MSLPTPTDRSEISGLHGVNSNSNMSHSRDRDHPEWGSKPTRIVVGAGRSFNPFGGSSMRNNLHSQSRGSYTFAKHEGSSRPNKRQKVDNDGNSVPTSCPPQRKKNMTATPAQQRAQKVSNDQVIEVSDEQEEGLGEDLGVPLNQTKVGAPRPSSPDPLNITSDIAKPCSEQSPSILKGLHPFNTHTSPSKDQIDGIVCSDDDVVEFEPPFHEQKRKDGQSKPGYVKQQVVQWEGRTKTAVQVRSQMTDLTKIRKVSKSMKGKHRPTGNPLGLRKMSSPPSNKKVERTGKSKAHAYTSTEDPTLPISNLVEENRSRHEAGYCLAWNLTRKAGFSIENAGKGVFRRMDFKDLASIEYGSDADKAGEHVLIIHKAPHRLRTDEDTDSSFIAIKVSPGESDGEMRWQDFISHVKANYKKSKALDPTAAASAWQLWALQEESSKARSSQKDAPSPKKGPEDSVVLIEDNNDKLLQSISTPAMCSFEPLPRPKPKPRVRQRSDSVTEVGKAELSVPPQCSVLKEPSPQRLSPGRPIAPPGSTRAVPNTITTYPNRRTTRQSGRASITPAVPTVLNDASKINPDEVILVYPPNSAGAVNITAGDLERLKPGEFLNDNLIEFGLKLWLKEIEANDPAQAAKIHVFSSFFYKKLNKKNIEDGYQSVRKWTSKLDIFEKEYIIVPINENLHWYLAIIHQPKHVLLPPLPEPVKKVNSTRSTRSSARHAPLEHTADSKPTPMLLPRPESEPISISISPDNSGATEVEELLTQSCSISAKSLSPKEEDAMVVDEASKTPTATKIQAPKKEEEEEEEEEVPDSEAGDANPDTNFFLRWPSSPTSNLQPTLTHGGDAKQASTTEEIPPSQFYGTLTSSNDHRTAEPMHIDTEDDPSCSVPTETAPSVNVDDAVDEVQLPVPDVEITKIHTLDSLGSRHPRAIEVLSQYLQLEAKDKRDLQSSRKPIGSSVSVPLQPNFCDCGVFLLDLARLFMHNPERYYYNVEASRGKKKAERREIWNLPEDSRDNLCARIINLSEQWKFERKDKEEPKVEEDKNKVKASEKADSSDSDIEFVTTVESPSKGRKGRGGRQR